MSQEATRQENVSSNLNFLRHDGSTGPSLPSDGLFEAKSVGLWAESNASGWVGSVSGRPVPAARQTATNPESLDARASKVAVARHPRAR